MPERKCYTCGGRGSVDTIGEEPCQYCAGSGRDTKSDCWSEPCRYCNGKGRVVYNRRATCNACHGRGTIHY
jgi:DnaJ-class molecular chaperone